MFFSSAGWIRDTTGTYDLTFYIAGAGIFVSGFMLIIIPFLHRCDPIVRRNSALHSNDLGGNHGNQAANTSHNNSNQQGSNRLLCSGQQPTTSPDAEIAPLFSSRSNNDVTVRVSECESVV